MADLRTNYKDDVLDTSLNEKRKYRMITNDDGTVSFEDVTEYLQVGDSFGSVDINKTNEEIENVKEEVDTKLSKSGGQITGKITTSNNASYETNGNIFSPIYGGNLYDLLAEHNTSINNFNNAIAGLQSDKLSLSGGKMTGKLTTQQVENSTGYTVGANNNAFSTAPFVSSAPYNTNTATRAGYGFHNHGNNGTFLFLAPNGNLSHIGNTGNIKKIMDSSHFSVSGTTLNITTS